MGGVFAVVEEGLAADGRSEQQLRLELIAVRRWVQAAEAGGIPRWG